MKTMNCKQLGGACDLEFQANTFEEISDLSKKHGMEMFQAGDRAHIEAMGKMRELMTKPKDMQNWFNEKRKQFDALPNQ